VKIGVKAELAQELLGAERASSIEAEPMPLGIRPSQHVRAHGRPMVSFANWDLLDIHTHPSRSRALAQAAELGRVAAGAPRTGTGSFVEHVRAEQRVAQLFGAESALLFPTRNQAVLSVLTAFVRAGGLVVCDQRVSAPVADACALIGAELVEWDGVTPLSTVLNRLPGPGRVVVYLESGSSHWGDYRDITADLAACDLAGAWAVVDESCALGLMGLRGAGSADALLPCPSLLARIAGFNYVAGVDIAAVAGCAELRELLLRRSRFLRAEPAPSPATAAELEAAIDLLEGAIAARKKLSLTASRLRGALGKQGWTVFGAPDSPIVSVAVDRGEKAASLQSALASRGVVVDALALRPYRGCGSVARALISVRHTEQELSLLLEALAELRRRMRPLSQD
jgi:7-keto-8-aminopelargonate synthetase-like enzyme